MEHVLILPCKSVQQRLETLMSGATLPPAAFFFFELKRKKKNFMLVSWL